jgi:N4-gp56 family major capsid protein
MISASDGFNTSPVAPAYIGVISDDTLYDLKKDSDWVPIEEYAQSDGRLGSFEKGKLDDVRFVLAGSNAKTFSSTVTVHATIILGKEAYGVSRISGEAAQTITKPLGSAGTADPLNQRSTMGWKITFVAKRLQENFMIRIEHAVSS